MQVKPKKSLGQNFLIDNNILEKIANVVSINETSEILEIGAGTGNLTNFLIKKKPNKISLVEKDKNLAFILENKFAKKVRVYTEDFLNFSDVKIFNKNLIIFGNLPYNVSSQILIKLILNKENLQFKKMVFMFQKELADRILSEQNSKNYGRISIIANWKYNIKKIIDISPNSFYPKPKIKSSLLLFTPKQKYFKLKKSESLEYVTRIFFNQRRKKIKKPINILFKNTKNLDQKINLNYDLRPQNLSIETFLKIASEYENLVG